MNRKYFLFLFLFSIITFSIAEILTRKIYGYNITSKNFSNHTALLESNYAVMHDDLLSWNHKPNLVSKNGLNTDDNSFRISRKYKNNIVSRKTIFVSGSSFAAGSEVSDHETWPFYLEKQINTKVINAAVGGWDSFQIIQNVKKNLNKTKPDMVILQFTDAIERSKYKIYASAYKSRYKIINDKLVLSNYPVTKFNKKKYLSDKNTSEIDKIVNHSFFTNILNNSLFLYKLQKKFFNAPYGLNVDKVYVKDDKNIFDLNCKLINNIKDILDKKNIELFFVIQHRGDLVLNKMHDLQPINEQKLQSCLIKSNIRFINFWEILKDYYFQYGESEFKKLYKMKNNMYFGHMSNNGNMFVAKKIKDFFFE